MKARTTDVELDVVAHSARIVILEERAQVAIAGPAHVGHIEHVTAQVLFVFDADSRREIALPTQVPATQKQGLILVYEQTVCTV